MAKQKIQDKVDAKKPWPIWAWLAILAIVFAFVYPYIFNEKVDLGGDNAGYYVLGKALSSGQGYHNVHLPDNPAHNHFPPGYPAILSVFMMISSSLTFLKVVNGLFLLGTSALLFLLFKRFTDSTKMAFVGAILVFFNFHLLSYGTILMSEVPFLFFSTLAMLLFVKVQDKTAFLKDPNFYLLLLVSSFAYHIRTAGIALVAGFALYMLINKNWKMFASYLGGFALLGLPWFLRGQNLGGSSYLTQLFLKNPYRPENGSMEIGDWFERFGSNFMRYLGKEIPNGVLPGLPVGYTEDGQSHIFVGIILLALIVYGIIKLPNYRWLLGGYFLGTFGILLLWPDVWFGIRFVLPLIPFLAFLSLYGLYKLIVFILQKMSIQSAPNPLIFALMVLFFMPQLKLLKEAADAPYPPKFKNYFETGAYINQNLPSDAVVYTRKPGLLYIFAGRKVAKMRATSDYNEMLDHMDENKVTHVVIDQLGYADVGRYLVPIVQDNPEKFGVIHQIPAPDTYLLQYNPDIGYRGEWRIEENNGMYTHTKEGHGTFINSDGTKIEGRWENGQLIEQTNESASK